MVHTVSVTSPPLPPIIHTECSRPSIKGEKATCSARCAALHLLDSIDEANCDVVLSNDWSIRLWYYAYYDSEGRGGASGDSVCRAQTVTVRWKMPFSGHYLE